MKARLTILNVVFICSIGIVFWIVMRSVVGGSISFWFDPARDLLLALDNVQKPTLIGPPSGIPGVFYGPYWIWLLSVALIFSKDPRFVVFVALTVPYIFIFPLVLWKFSRIIGKVNALLLWWLFYVSSVSYMIFLWNPHLSPLIFLVLIYMVISIDYEKREKLPAPKIAIVGFLAGLLTNFHISFGVAITVSTCFYLFLLIMRFGKRSILPACKAIFIFFSGFFLSFLPFLIFESRHGFNQVRSIFFVLQNSILYNSAVVGQTGLTKIEILKTFFEVFGKILHMPVQGIHVLLVVIAGYGLAQIMYQNIHFTSHEKRLSTYLFFCCAGILFVFLSSKNPVWTYHFIGTEIIVLLLTGLVVHKFPQIQKIMVLWVAILVIYSLYTSLKPASIHPRSISTLYTKEYIVDLIVQDAKNDTFSVYIYSPAIYTFDYDYLFRWRGYASNVKTTKSEISESNYTYLIIPETSDEIRDDFIEYRTPKQSYKTEYTWDIEDKTTIVKRSAMKI